MRLSFCYPAPDRIREGVRRLANTLTEEMDLVRIFGSVSQREVPGPHSPSPDTA